MGKVFISTLGASEYSLCKYRYNGNDLSDECRYVQESSIQTFCKGWDNKNGDRIRILCTDTAYHKNWLDDGYKDPVTKKNVKNIGLDNCLQRLFQQSQYNKINGFDIRVTIPDGKNESEIWEIFQALFEQINDGDEVWFDITHAFRSIPMLILVVITYARVLKNITVKSITYGAYEARENNIAPVFDLTKFVTLLDWANAAKDFIDYGQTKKLLNVLSDEINPKLKETKGMHSEAKCSKAVAIGIEELVGSIKKNKLTDIVIFNSLKELLHVYYLNTPSEMKTFIPVVKKIEEKIAPFEEKSWGNVFAATRWCINHGMYQNAYSILLEGCISIALKAAGETKIVTVTDDTKEIRKEVQDKRSMVVVATMVQIKKLNKEKIGKDLAYLLPLMEKLLDVIPVKTSQQIDQLKNHRNGYMHCGTGEPVPGKLIEDIEVLLPELEEWYKTVKNRIDF